MIGVLAGGPQLGETMLTSLLLLNVAFAGDCDVASMSKEIVEMGPHEAAPLFVSLAKCDPKAAKRMAAKVMPTLIGEQSGFEAAIAAIEVGEGQLVLDWIAGLERDEQSRAVRVFGVGCQENPAIQVFLVGAEKRLEEKFWSDRWYRALTECRTPGTTGVLSAKVEAGVGSDRGAFFSIIEAYSVNLGDLAIPKLVALVEAESDKEMQINLVGAFSDAAQAGTVNGVNVEIAGMAATALRQLAPKLAPEAVDKARMTLNVLLDEAGADALVAVRFKDRLSDDQTLLYGTVAFENAVCKNGKSVQRYHVAEVVDPGQTWPDQLQDKVRSNAELLWTLNLAERCKGEGEVLYFTPDAPFIDADAFKKWTKATIQDQIKPEAKKATRVDEEPIGL